MVWSEVVLDFRCNDPLNPLAIHSSVEVWARKWPERVCNAGNPGEFSIRNPGTLQDFLHIEILLTSSAT
jgi:hypothetical protein